MKFGRTRGDWEDEGWGVEGGGWVVWYGGAGVVGKQGQRVRISWKKVTCSDINIRRRGQEGGRAFRKSVGFIESRGEATLEWRFGGRVGCLVQYSRGGGSKARG